MRKYSLFPTTLIFLFIVSIIACSKKDDDPTPTPSQEEITVSNISPNAGPYSTIVTITGSGFNSTASSNIVKFNGKTASVQSASSTQLVVVVPEAAGTGNVTVEWGSKSATGPVFNFNYTITVSTFAGTGTPGFADGSSSVTQFAGPIAMTIDAQDNIYVADYGNQRIRKVTPAGVSSTFAGSGTPGTANGTGSVAQFSDPAGLDFDVNGNLYVADQGSHLIRKITPASVVSTIAGSTQGFADANGPIAQFSWPTGVATDASGNIYIADMSNRRVRKISPSFTVSTLAGSGTNGLVDGTGVNASFNSPTGLTTDAIGNILVTDYANGTIRKVTPAGVVTTIAGMGMLGFTDGIGTAAMFNYPTGITSASDGTIYVGDRFNHKIRMITPSREVITIAGSTAGFVNGSGTTAKFDNPTGVVIDSHGIVFVSEMNNHCIRKIRIQ